MLLISIILISLNARKLVGLVMRATALDLFFSIHDMGPFFASLNHCNPSTKESVVKLLRDDSFPFRELFVNRYVSKAEAELLVENYMHDRGLQPLLIPFLFVIGNEFIAQKAFENEHFKINEVAPDGIDVEVLSFSKVGRKVLWKEAKNLWIFNTYGNAEWAFNLKIPFAEELIDYRGTGNFPLARIGYLYDCCTWGDDPRKEMLKNIQFWDGYTELNNFRDCLDLTNSYESLLERVKNLTGENEARHHLWSYQVLVVFLNMVFSRKERIFNCKLDRNVLVQVIGDFFAKFDLRKIPAFFLEYLVGQIFNLDIHKDLLKEKRNIPAMVYLNEMVKDEYYPMGQIGRSCAQFSRISKRLGFVYPKSHWQDRV